jgi:hypothetical protein
MQFLNFYAQTRSGLRVILTRYYASHIGDYGYQGIVETTGEMHCWKKNGHWSSDDKEHSLDLIKHWVGPLHTQPGNDEPEDPANWWKGQ